MQPIAAGLEAVLALLLLAAIVGDLAAYRIPNWLTAAVALGFLPWATLAGPPDGWPWHFAVGAAALAAGMGLFALGWLGGGDAKLLAATSLWMGLSQIAAYLMLVALIGGLFSLIVLAARYAAAHGRRPVAGAGGRRPRLLTHGEPVPYGVAVAGAGLVVVALRWLG